MTKLVSVEVHSVESTELDTLTSTISQAQDQAAALDHKFLAYLLGLASIEAQRLGEETKP